MKPKSWTEGKCELYYSYTILPRNRKIKSEYVHLNDFYVSRYLEPNACYTGLKAQGMLTA